MDWSGKSDRDKYLICVLAAIQNAEAWSEKCADLRHELGMKQSTEFHARDMSELENFTVLQTAKDGGIIFGAFVMERPDEVNGQNISFSYDGIAQELFHAFAARYQVRTLWYDKEIQGRMAEQTFETKLRRINRTIYPKSTFKARSRPSDKSDLIQAADSLAYMIHRLMRNAIGHHPLKMLVRQLLNDERNIWIRFGE